VALEAVSVLSKL